MNFDRTFIAVRQRSIFEILDLTLHVIREYIVPLAVLLIIGALPFFVFDWLVIGWMTTDMNSADFKQVYVLAMTFLVLNQAHVGTAFITHYLGQAIFEGRPSIAKTIKQTIRVNPFFWWVHGGLRLVFPVIFLSVFLREEYFDTEFFGLAFSGFLICTGVGLVVRAFRPFASEMFLLERTPVKRKGESVIDFASRSSSLHGAASSELFGRFVLVTCLSFPLTFMVYGSFLKGDNLLNLHIDPEATMVTWYWPVSLWVVAGFAATVRFLSYLDIRIRQEGWAVELRVRAEALRLVEAAE